MTRIAKRAPKERGAVLVVALVIGQLTAGLKVQVAAVTERERRVTGLGSQPRVGGGSYHVLRS